MPDRPPFKIVTDMAQLPDPSSISHEVFADIEGTSNGNPRKYGSNPYKGDRIAGFAFTFDDHPTAYYLPLNHRGHPKAQTLFAPDIKNLPIENVRRYMRDVWARGKPWINHNIKFDAHFFACDGMEGFEKNDMVCTITTAKIVDMQARSHQGRQYRLDHLVEDWLGRKPDSYNELLAECNRLKTLDYGMVDPSILGEYACDDVQNNRDLWRLIQSKRYEGDQRIWDIERRATKMLYRVERRGIRVDTAKLKDARERCANEIDRARDEIDRLGFAVDVSSTKSLIGFIIDTLGLPIVARTERGAPSINYDAIKAYQELIGEKDEKLRQFFSLLETFRDNTQFLGLYAEGWPEHMDENGVLHCSYNQCVATGRMSCSSPNMQQLSKDAKTLIVPDPGMWFLSRDYSQIEYRIIASLCKDERIIEAYKNDASTDFHVFVANLCGIERDPAKNVNFGIAFGMGEEGLIAQLSRLIGGEAANNRANKILSTYHRTFPRVKETANFCKTKARERAGWVTGGVGWVKTLYGRRRALKYVKFNEVDPDGGWDDTRKAFNTVVQGTAADIAKAQSVMVDEHPELSEALGLRAIVHDEFLACGLKEVVCDPRYQKMFDEAMTAVEIDLGLPLYVDGGQSGENWRLTAKPKVAKKVTT